MHVSLTAVKVSSLTAAMPCTLTQDQKALPNAPACSFSSKVQCYKMMQRTAKTQYGDVTLV